MGKARDNPIVKAKYDKKYYQENKEKRKAYTREHNKKVRLELIDLLGGKCLHCGFDDWRALQVDHVNGGGRKDVQSMKGMKNWALLKRIKGGSKDYQLLCSNCNWIKRYENNETGMHK